MSEDHDEEMERELHEMSQEIGERVKEIAESIHPMRVALAGVVLVGHQCFRSCLCSSCSLAQGIQRPLF